MIQKILFSIGFLLMYGIVDGLEHNTMTIGQAIAWALIVIPVTIWSFVHTDWYDPTGVSESDE